MAEQNVEPGERNLRISGNNPDVVRRCHTLAGFAVEAGGDDGIAIQLLEPGTTLIVKTRNSLYRFVVLEGVDLDVSVEGGRMFHDPTRVRLEGATAGRSLLKVGWVGVGLRLEMSVGGRRIFTSAVQSITIECANRENPANSRQMELHGLVSALR